MVTMRDIDFESKGDAYTLAHADAIRKDKARLARAVKAAKEMVHDREIKLASMRKVANSDTSNSGKMSNSQLFKESIDYIMRR